MKNKILMILMIGMAALFAISLASAYVPNRAPYANGVAYGYASYGSYPVNPSTYGGVQYQYSYPASVGGWFGQSSAFMVGLRPGVYDSPNMNYGTRYAISSNYYPRAGGWFGGYGGYYNLRPGTFVYSGGMPGYGGTNSYFHGAW